MRALSHSSARDDHRRGNSISVARGSATSNCTMHWACRGRRWCHSVSDAIPRTAHTFTLIAAILNAVIDEIVLNQLGRIDIRGIFRS
ncbi:hypothetical protein [Pendulispora albinea]|uniref:Uncharacterized protein n=1 Tax=Pendulispora albinea TaxID=2741071 RepID=A0ABZ2LW72_9BACT